MKETSYYKLKMPDSNDTIDVSVLNNNMKILDDVLVLTVIGRTAETSEFVKKCCAPYIMIQNLGDETVTIYDRRWPEDMWEDNKIVIEPSKFHVYKVANIVNANFLVLDSKECRFEYFITAEQAIAEGGGGGGGGTTDYNELDNQPKINGFTLIGNKTFKDLGLVNDDGKIKSDYLPPFVDNMDSYDTEADFPRPGVEDRLYLDKSTNLAYVWAGTDYACIGTPLALGITHETAGYGDESRAAYNHSLSEHARVDATKTEGSSQNGYIKINEAETKVYEHPGSGTNPHGTTKTDVGLGNLLNAKQVTVTEQAYSETEKAQARNNIGAGTSSFSGKYSDLSEIPSEFTPAEHNHDDLYAHKTSVSLSKPDGETTSVINVTDAKAQMAMVAKISGKTYKKNLLPLKKFAASTEVNKVTLVPTYDGDKLLYITISGTATGGNADFDLTDGFTVQFVNGKSYILTGCPAGGSESKYRLLVQDTAYAVNPVDYGAGSTFIANANKFRATIRIIEGQTVNLKFYPMIRESTITNGEYVPYGTLLSAPVESVVSNSANLFNKDTCVDGGLETDGSVGSNSQTAVSDYIPVIGGETYFLNNVPNQSVARTCAEYDVNKTFIKITSFSSPNISGSIIMSANTRYIRITVKRTDKNIVTVNRGTTAMAYSPYNKTTVLVPSEARNCVGYGLGIGSVSNESDFENGAYYQRVKLIDLKSLNWKYDTTYKYFYSDAISDIKKPNWDSEPSLICSKYTGKNWNAGIGKADKTISINYTSGLIGITDLSYTDATAFKNALSDAKLVYELATPVVTPLKDFIRPLPVENGGTLTLVNEHNLDMPSVIKYKKEV